MVLGYLASIMARRKEKRVGVFNKRLEPLGSFFVWFGRSACLSSSAPSFREAYREIRELLESCRRALRGTELVGDQMQGTGVNREHPGLQRRAKNLLRRVDQLRQSAGRGGRARPAG